MNQTPRPNVKWSQVGYGERGQASPSAIDGLAVRITLVLGLAGAGAALLLSQLSEFWAGIVLGGLSGVVLVIGLLAVGACLGGARLDAPSRQGACDRGMH
ncbi:MAG: hypothetical protein H8K10_02030 [Nitrospira sp.]|nr:hypothetical protein [Nitrospira sp.]